MTLYRAMVVHKHLSGLPRDQFVNTFHVLTSSGGPSAGEAEDVAEVIRDFYVIDVPSQTESIADQFSDVVATTNHEVRMYGINVATGANLAGDGEPPVWTEVFDHLGRSTAGSRQGYPSEVALCLSYRNVSDGGTPVARRRGRIYLGPLAQITGAEGGSQVPRPPSTFRDFVLAAANRLHDDLHTAGFDWVIYSRPFAGRGEVERPGRPTLPAIPARAGSTHLIERLWIDDAFDTQRRRGERATTRTELTP